MTAYYRRAVVDTLLVWILGWLLDLWCYWKWCRTGYGWGSWGYWFLLKWWNDLLHIWTDALYLNKFFKQPQIDICKYSKQWGILFLLKMVALWHLAQGHNQQGAFCILGVVLMEEFCYFENHAHSGAGTILLNVRQRIFRYLRCLRHEC